MKTIKKILSLIIIATMITTLSISSSAAAGTPTSSSNLIMPLTTPPPPIVPSSNYLLGSRYTGSITLSPGQIYTLPVTLSTNTTKIEVAISSNPSSYVVVRMYLVVGTTPILMNATTASLTPSYIWLPDYNNLTFGNKYLFTIENIGQTQTVINAGFHAQWK